MKTDAGKTKAQLIEELDRLRQRVVQLEAPQGAQGRSAASLHKSEQRYRLLFETNGSFTVCVAPDFRILEFNHEAERLSGWKREEVLGQDYRKLFLPKADWNAAEAAMDQVLAGTPIRNLEHYIVTKTGEKRILLWNVTRLLDPNGYPIQLIATGQDITEHKRIEAALQESEERYRITSQSISDFAFSYQVSPDGSYVMEWLTDSFTKLTGYAVDELVGKPNILESFVHPDDFKRVVETIQTLKPGTVDLTELRFRTKGGGYRWLGSYTQTMAGKEEGYVQIYGACQDITERKRAEDALRESEERYRSLVDMSPDAIYVHTGGKIVYINTAGTRLFGAKSPQDLIGREVLDFIHPDYWDNDAQPVRRIEKHQSAGLVERKMVRLDGQVIEVEAAGNLVAYQGRSAIQVVARDITQRKRSEEALRTQALVLEEMSEGVTILGEDGIITFTNPAWDAMFGYGAGELIGQHVSVLNYPPEEADRVAQHVIAGLQEHGAWEGEVHSRKKDGSPFLTYARAKALEFTNQKLWLSVQQDITESKRAEEALRTSEERFALAVQGTYDGLWDWNLVTDEVYYSARFEELLGYVEHELEAHIKSFDALLHPEDRERINQAVQEHYERHTPYDVEWRGRMKSGEYRWFRSRAQAVWDEAGKPLRMAGSIRDVTERKQAEIALRESEERFRTLASSSPIGIYQADCQGVSLYTNPMWQQISGLTFEENLGSGWLQAIAQEDREAVAAEWQQCLQGSREFSPEYRVVRPDGEVRWVHSQAAAIRSETQELPGYVGTVVDITERKRAEIALQHAHDELEQRVVERTVALARANDQLRAEITERGQAEKALRKSEEHYRAVVEDQTELICRFTPDTQLTFVNDAYCRYFNKSREALLGQSFVTLLPEQERPAAHAHITSLITHPQLMSDEHTVIAANGEVRWMQWMDRALLDERGNVVEFQSIGRDITQQKRLEEKLRAGENLIATGRMAAGVAHEINNPLAGIKNAFLLIKDAVPHNHPHYAFVGRIDKEIDRIANIVRQMYDLYRPQADVPHQFQIVPVMQDVLSLLSPNAQKYGVTLVLDPPSPPVQATLPESSLRQVLFNLIKNAIEASPHGQEVRITLACVRDSLSLAVIDQGSGISADIRARIFEPFFSTKKEQTYTGMGLGLSISYSLVQAMGGELTFESVPDEGTVFRVTLPLVVQASKITLNGEQALVSSGPSVNS